MSSCQLRGADWCPCLCLQNACIHVADWLIETDPSEQQTEYIRSIQTSASELSQPSHSLPWVSLDSRACLVCRFADLMLAIVNDTLDLGKLEAGRVELEVSTDPSCSTDRSVGIHDRSSY